MDRARRQLLIAGSLGLGLASAGVLRRSATAPRTAVRDRPPVLRAGFVHAGHPTGQRVLLPEGRLTALEWTVVGRTALGEAPRTRVHRASLAGPVLADVANDDRPGPDGTLRLRSRFDPPLEVGDEPLFLGLAPADGRERTEVSPVLRLHAAAATPLDRGRARLVGPELVRHVSLDHDQWTALAVAFHRLPPDAGPVTLVIEALEVPPQLQPFPPQPTPGALDGVQGTEVRRMRIERPPALDTGHLLLSFDPLVDARGRLFRLRLAPPVGAVVAGDGAGFGCVPFHGRLQSRAPWIDATVGGRQVPFASLQLALWHDGERPRSR